MKSLAIFSTLLVACSTAVSAWSCLSDADAQNIIKEQIVFLQHSDLAAGRAAGEALFAPDFKEYGDSINALRMDAVRFPSFSTCQFWSTFSHPPAFLWRLASLTELGPSPSQSLTSSRNCSLTRLSPARHCR